MKTIIERGASWTLVETKLLLVLWGQDLIQRQATCLKRTKEVYEKISESFAHAGFVRTPDQVRTRVFNMIAEYRRILRDPNPERRKKCVFFEPLHRIYQAKHMDDVKSALDDYEPENPYSPTSNTNLSDRGDESISDSDVLDDTLINDNAASSNNGDNVNGTNSISDDVPVATSQTSSNKNSANSATINNNGESIIEGTDSDAAQVNQESGEKEGASTSTHQGSIKRIKLESPKASTSQGSNLQESKTKNNLAATSNASASVSGIRQQSLLLPHGTSTSQSTPLTKMTTSASNLTPSYININSTKMPIIRTNQFLGHTNGNEGNNPNGTPSATRLPTTAAITSHQLYQAPVNTFDVTSSALLIDRMFAHLSRESENMRDWIALEKERIALERTRRAQEAEREIRRERVLIDTLLKFHESWISFINRIDPRIVEAAAANNPLPELNIPPRESEKSADNVTSQSTANTGQPTSSSNTATSSTPSTASATASASTTTTTTSSST